MTTDQKLVTILDDAPEIRDMLSKGLADAGFATKSYGRALEFERDMRTISPDVCIIDLGLPDKDGLALVNKIALESGAAIIIISGRSMIQDKIAGLELGADDYIIKPFSLRELLARVKAVLRRTETSTVSEDKLTVGNITFDFQRYEAFENEEQVKLSHKEFEIVHHLWKNRNTIVSRDQLLREVWNYESQPTTRTVDNFILKIRQKIEENPNSPKYILTVHGAGYKLVL